MNPTDLVDRASLRDDIPDFAPGDTLKVHVRVVEGSKERVQVFQGVVIRRQGSGVRETFTVRKVSFGVGVERTFPVHSPIIAKIEVVTRGDVRRAKLYYLRDRVGKAAKIKEKRATVPLTRSPRRTVAPMSRASDLEQYEAEIELQLYKEYKDVCPMFSFVVETERRFYLANARRPAGPRRRTAAPTSSSSCATPGCGTCTARPASSRPCGSSRSRT